MNNLVQKYISYLTVAVIIIYTIAAMTVCLNRYWQNQVNYFDYGIFDAAIWKVAHFQPPVIDHFEIALDHQVNIFASHFYPSIFLISPLYWLTDRSELLVVVQTLAVGLAALVAFKTGDKLIKNKLALFALIVAFLGYVGLQSALVTEFHETTVAVLPFTAVFWAIVNKKWKLYFLFLVIFLGFKETFVSLGFLVGVFLYFRCKEHKIAIWTMAISIIWGLLAFKIIIPYYSPSNMYLYANHNFELNPLDMIKNFFSPLVKVKTMFYSLLTFGFLPLLEWPFLLMILDNFFQRYVLAVEVAKWDLGFHYNALLSPIMFFGAIYAIQRLEHLNPWKHFINFYSVFIILVVLVLHQFVLHGSLGLFYNRAFYQPTNGRNYVDEFVKHFPKSGTIMTQNNLAVKLAHQNVVLLRERPRIIDHDYVILNLTQGQTPNSFAPPTYEGAVKIKDLLLLDKGYKLQKYGPELYIFTKIR